MTCPAVSAPKSIPNDVTKGEVVLGLECYLKHLPEMYSRSLTGSVGHMKAKIAQELVLKQVGANTALRPMEEA